MRPSSPRRIRASRSCAATSAPTPSRTSPRRPSPRSRAEPETEAERAARALSDALSPSSPPADLIVIASPMYNFGMSSTLKAWFDHVAARRHHLPLPANRPGGADEGKKAVVIESRGGLYSEGPGAAMDSQEPHIRDPARLHRHHRRHLRPRREARFRARGRRGGDRRGARGARRCSPARLCSWRLNLMSPSP